MCYCNPSIRTPCCGRDTCHVVAGVTATTCPWCKIKPKVMNVYEETLIAATIARLAHHGQRTKSDDQEYITHVITVVSNTPDLFKPVAWLHDVIEDSDITVEHLRAAGISEQTIKSVVILTRVKPDVYTEYIDRIIASDDFAALVVKRADLMHNLRPSCPNSLRVRYLEALPRIEAAMIAGSTAVRTAPDR